MREAYGARDRDQRRVADVTMSAMTTRTCILLLVLITAGCTSSTRAVRVGPVPCMTVEELRPFWPFQFTCTPYYQAVLSRVEGTGRGDGRWWVIVRFADRTALTRATEGGLVLREHEFRKGAQFRLPTPIRVVDCSPFDVPNEHPEYRCLEVSVEDLERGCGN